MVSKSTHLGTRLEPESYKKSQIDMPGPSLENHLKKVTNHPQTQTLEIQKVVLGGHETIVFTIPAFLQHVWKCGPKGPSFESLWVPKSVKDCQNKLQTNH